jgi:uncharacterized protein YjbI with pentapeptide repeats
MATALAGIGNHRSAATPAGLAGRSLESGHRNSAAPPPRTQGNHPMTKTLALAALVAVALAGATSASAAIEPNGMTINGIQINGLNWNGVNFNGVVFNGMTLNGMTINGMTINGMTINGTFPNGAKANGIKTNGMARITAMAQAAPMAAPKVTVRAVVLASGETVSVR